MANVAICESCGNPPGNDATQLDVASIDGELVYCDPLCMLDDWQGRCDWYVEGSA